MKHFEDQDVFLNYSVREHSVKTVLCECQISATRMGARHDKRRSRGNGGKIEWKLSEVNVRAVSRGQNELIGKFKMRVGDMLV